MGLIKNIVSGLGNIVKSVAPSIIKTVAPIASNLLGKVAGDIFQKGAGFIGNALKALPLPSPLKDLATKLLGTGVEKLTQFAQGGIEKLIGKLADTLISRIAPGAGSVTPPTMSTPERQAGITQGNNQVTGSNTGAASGTGGTGSAGAPASGGAPSKTGFGWDGAAPSPVGRDMSDPNVAAKFQDEMMRYQQAMTNMQNYFQMISQAFKSNADTTKQLISALR